MYILSPHEAGILYPPPFYTPPTPRRVFSGVGGWGCIKFQRRIRLLYNFRNGPSPPHGSMCSGVSVWRVLLDAPMTFAAV